MYVKIFPSAPDRNISFSVKDGSDNAVQGAKVVLGKREKTTGSAGGCSFNDVTDGSHTVAVTKTGFTDYSGTIIVNEENDSFTITLTAVSP